MASKPVSNPGSTPKLPEGGDAPKWTRLPVRTRPHRNPLAENDDGHPRCPDDFHTLSVDRFAKTAEGVEIADIGCAFGGMLISLAPHFPQTAMLGLEIRPRIAQFAQEKVQQLRDCAHVDSGDHHFTNVWFEQCNVMKFGTRFFRRGQLSRLFFCHPDPHWKAKNVRRRIVSPGLVHIYAYWLRIGGLLYTVSDVPELEQWMIACLDACPLFERLSEAEILDDETVVGIAVSTSEDAQRAQRKGLPKNFAVHRRVAGPVN